MYVYIYIHLHINIILYFDGFVGIGMGAFVRPDSEANSYKLLKNSEVSKPCNLRPFEKHARRVLRP